MPKHPPHLPNKTCRVDTYYRLQNVKWILLFAVFAFIAGGSSAIIVSSWLLPTYNGEQVISRNSDNRFSLLATPDILWQKQTKQRMLTVYDKRLQSEDNIFSSGSQVGFGVIFSSDGWAVMKKSDYLVGQEKFWNIIDWQSVNYSIEKTVFDRNSGLVYFKIMADGLRVVSFSDWKSLVIGTYVWSGTSEWAHHYISSWEKTSDKNLINISEPQYSYSFDANIPTNDLLWAESGDFIGFVGDEKQLIYSWQLEKQLAGLLSKGKLANQVIPWQGYPVTSVDLEGKEFSGFYLEKITDKNSLLKKGDIIISINNEPTSRYELARQIMSTPEQFNVTVWRQDKVETVLVNKVM